MGNRPKLYLQGKGEAWGRAVTRAREYLLCPEEAVSYRHPSA